MRLRQNSKRYRQQLVTDLRTPTHIRDIVIADMGNHLRIHLDVLEALWNDAPRRTKAISGLLARGLTLSEVRSAYTELRSAVIAIRDTMQALPTSPTKPEVIAAIDALRASVTVHDRLDPDQE